MERSRCDLSPFLAETKQFTVLTEYLATVRVSETWFAERVL